MNDYECTNIDWNECLYICIILVRVNEVNDAGPRQEDLAVQDPPNFPFPSICQVCLSKNHFWFLIFSSSRRLIIQHSSTLKVRYWWPYLEYILYWLALGGYIDWKSRNQLHVVLFVYFFYIFLLIHCLHYLIFIFNFFYISNIDIFILVMSIPHSTSSPVVPLQLQSCKKMTKDDIR